MAPFKKIKVNWMEDSSHRITCHLNDGGMMAADSYIGRIYLANGKWFSIVKDSEDIVEHDHIRDAKKRVEDSVDGEQVNVWD